MRTERHIKLIAIVAAAMLSAAMPTAQAQYVRLTKATSNHGLYFDLNRLFNYNIYEQSRWGGGLRYIYSFDGNPSGRQFWFDAYGGYGSADRTFKYGVASSYKGGGNRQMRVGMSFVNDLEQAGSRNLESYTLTNLSANSSYMATRFSHIVRLTSSFESRVAPRLTLKVGIRASAEEYLFRNGQNAIYPALGDVDESARLFFETSILVDYKNRAKLSILTGSTNLPFEQVVGQMGMLYDRRVMFLRMILQYSRAWQIGEKGQFDLFCQLGTSTMKTPYSRMFDMGGTYGSIFYFTNAFLTLRPAEITANVYAQLCMRLASVKPLWNIDGYSTPKAYVQANIGWGALWNDEGQLVDNARFDGLQLTAIKDGLMEISAGFNNLLNINGIQIGAAAAYQLAPHWAPYHRDNPYDRLAFLSSATLIF